MDFVFLLEERRARGYTYLEEIQESDEENSDESSNAYTTDQGN